MMGTPTRKSIFALRYTNGAAKTAATILGKYDLQSANKRHEFWHLTKKYTDDHLPT
jgi:hypothetical protein